MWGLKSSPGDQLEANHLCWSPNRNNAAVEYNCESLSCFRAFRLDIYKEKIDFEKNYRRKRP